MSLTALTILAAIQSLLARCAVHWTALLRQTRDPRFLPVQLLALVCHSAQHRACSIVKEHRDQLVNQEASPPPRGAVVLPWEPSGCDGGGGGDTIDL